MACTHGRRGPLPRVGFTQVHPGGDTSRGYDMVLVTGSNSLLGTRLVKKLVESGETGAMSRPGKAPGRAGRR